MRTYIMDILNLSIIIFAKLITKGFVSRIKYNIINIDLVYKQIFTHF
jgi:hypothetical protein